MMTLSCKKPARTAILLSFILFLILQGVNLPAQTAGGTLEESVALRFVFYNAENLFDTLDDPGYDDATFTPAGERAWSFFLYRRKLLNLARVLLHCGQGRLPDLAGLCELEKRGVLEDLLRYSPLRNQGYELIHFESADPRGIDVGLIYRPSRLQPVSARPIRITFPSSGSRSRDILQAGFRLPDGQVLHVFINHWPSRFGGEQRTAPLRLAAAECLRGAIDSLKGEDPGALILAMGDFNDGPSDTSLQWLIADGSLLNLMLPLMGQPGGTHKHAGHWGILDQILVSPLLRDRKAWEAGPVSILSAPYLLQEETNQTGHRPFRSFAGNAYQGGFSDHLPVFVDLHYYGREH